MTRHWIVLAIGLLLLAPAAPADEVEETGEDSWWATGEPEPEVDYDWWHADHEVLVLQGGEMAAAEDLEVEALGAEGSIEDPAEIVAPDAIQAVEVVPSEGAQAPEDYPEIIDFGADAEATAEGSAVPVDPQATGKGASARDRDAAMSCRRWAKQLIKFAGDIEMARDRDNEVWEKVTQDHIDRLKLRFEDRCVPPGPTKMEFAKRFMKGLAKDAARLALKYFTAGIL